MKKILLIGAATLMVSNPTFAGGILTNTNQHASFLRMIARGASIDIDGVYSNPAGLSFLPEDGFYLSLTGQSAYQTREITSTFPLFQALHLRRALFNAVACGGSGLIVLGLDLFIALLVLPVARQVHLRDL